MDDNNRRISVAEPIGEAVTWTKNRLFHPFNPGEWFVYGFAWFLASLATFDGFSFKFNVNVGGPTGAPGDTFSGTPPSELLDQLLQWVGLAEVIIGVVIVLVLFAFLVLLLWLGSRGAFIFLDATLRDEAAIADPWHAYRKQGNSLFFVRLIYVLLGGILAIGSAGIGAVLFMLIDILSPLLIVGLVLCVLIWTLMFFVYMIGYQLLSDFVAQVMYRRDIRCWAACKLFWNDVLRAYPGTFLLFYLLKALLTIGSMFVLVIGGCLTCCIGFLPYLSNVIFLPIGVFFRTYSIRMLDQFGDEWALTTGDEQLAELF